eukprot:scaffold68820_cov30-Cyclotella_meneghiniana.AAC.1
MKAVGGIMAIAEVFKRRLIKCSNPKFTMKIHSSSHGFVSPVSGSFPVSRVRSQKSEASARGKREAPNKQQPRPDKTYIHRTNFLKHTTSTDTIKMDQESFNETNTSGGEPIIVLPPPRFRTVMDCEDEISLRWALMEHPPGTTPTPTSGSCPIDSA